MKLLTVEDVADVLGISRSKVYELISSGALPSVRIGRSRRVRVSDLDVFVERLTSH